MSRELIVSVDEEILNRAASKAATAHQSLDVLVRQWLSEYVAGQERVEQYRSLMQRLDHVRAPKGKISRDEMNER